MDVIAEFSLPHTLRLHSFFPLGQIDSKRSIFLASNWKHENGPQSYLFIYSITTSVSTRIEVVDLLSTNSQCHQGQADK